LEERELFDASNCSTTSVIEKRYFSMTSINIHSGTAYYLQRGWFRKEMISCPVNHPL